jgi:hypothetical protein
VGFRLIPSYFPSSHRIGIQHLDRNNDNASLSSNHVTFFILQSAMTCITGRFSLHYTIVYLFSFAVCLLPTRLRPYNNSGGHLILPFSRSSSNIFGDWIQLTTQIPSFVFFGILLFILRLQLRGYGTNTLLFCLQWNTIKICPLTISTMARIGCSWMRPGILFN